MESWPRLTRRRTRARSRASRPARPSLSQHHSLPTATDGLAYHEVERGGPAEDLSARGEDLAVVGVHLWSGEERLRTQYQARSAKSTQPRRLHGTPSQLHWAHPVDVGSEGRASLGGDDDARIGFLASACLDDEDCGGSVLRQARGQGEASCENKVCL